MSDLISRQAAIDTAIKESQADGAYGYMDAKDIVDMLKQLPSAQPERKPGKTLAEETARIKREILATFSEQMNAQPERKTSHWEQVEVSHLSDLDDEIKEIFAIASMFCPQCRRYHNEVYMFGDPTYGANYCPHCGCKMGGGS